MSTWREHHIPLVRAQPSKTASFPSLHQIAVKSPGCHQCFMLTHCRSEFPGTPSSGLINLLEGLEKNWEHFTYWISSLLWVSEVTQSCLTLCNPMDYSLPGSSVYGIFQARILEWVAISFSRGSSWPRDRTWVSRRCFTIWATREAPSLRWSLVSSWF